MKIAFFETHRITQKITLLFVFLLSTLQVKAQEIQGGNGEPRRPRPNTYVQFQFSHSNDFLPQATQFRALSYSLPLPTDVSRMDLKSQFELAEKNKLHIYSGDFSAAEKSNASADLLISTVLVNPTFFNKSTDTATAENSNNPMGMRARMQSENPLEFQMIFEVTGSNFANTEYFVANAKPQFNRTETSFNLMVRLPAIEIIGSPEKMDQVTIKTQVVKLKGDTTEMDATRFKTNPDATAEDLVGKMPGVSSSGGQIQAQGEQVKKVLVDGKPFFGDDPNAALKNLPAEVISKIQVFDAKSDQTLFTGIDDGNTSKTINIVTKSQFRTGMFGKGFAGIGRSIDGSGDLNKYKGGITVNSFKNSRRITLLSQANNINEQNFSMEDIVGAMGGGGGQRSGGGMGSMMGGRMMGGSDFFVGNQSGINTTRAIGLNYSNELGKKNQLEISGSYFLNYTLNNNESSKYRQYITGSGEGLIYQDTSPTHSTNLNHRLNARFNWKIDSNNTLLFTPRVSFQNNFKESPLTALTTYGDGVTAVSNLINNSKNTNTGWNANMGITYKHAFKKKGRTITLAATPGLNKQDGNINLLNINNISIPVLDTISRDQQTNNNKIVQSLNASVNFTETLDTNNILSASLQTNINQNNNNKEVLLYNTLYQKYSMLDTGLSSRFKNGYSNQQLGVNYRYQNYKFNITLGVTGQIAQLNGSQKFPFNTAVNKTFYSVLPSIQGGYKLGMKKNLRFNFNSSNNAPSIDQLQPVVNNSNIQQLSSGNVNLVQDFQNSLFLRYFSIAPEKNRNFFALISGTYTQNYLTYKTFINGRNGSLIDMYSYLGIKDSVRLMPGSQLSIPVNVDGYFSLRLFGSWGRSFKKLNFNTNAGATITQTPSIIQYENGKELTNKAINPSFNLGVVLSSNISEHMDFTVSSNSTYSLVKNSIQTNLNQAYLNQASRAMVNYMPNSSWVISSDVTHQLYTGFSSSFNQNYFLWNAGIGYKFLKNKMGELRLTAYDILNQNRSIQRNVTQTYFEDVRSAVLTRYVLITFTYKVRQFKGNQQPGASDKDKKMFMIPGQGGMPSGGPGGPGFPPGGMMMPPPNN